MANPSLVPSPGGKPERIGTPQPVTVPKAVVAPATLPTPAVTGPRKLVRPPMSAASPASRMFARRQETPLTARMTANSAAVAKQESSHAEVFYFQKQVQTQTLMTIVLDDGESIEGVIEWYDHEVIKVRHGARTMIYKSCIKYLYKSGENQKP